MAHARRVIETWRIEYNTERPHSSLGNLTPEQSAKNEDLLVDQLQIAQATELVVLVVLIPAVFSLHHAKAHD